MSASEGVMARLAPDTFYRCRSCPYRAHGERPRDLVVQAMRHGRLTRHWRGFIVFEGAVYNAFRMPRLRGVSLRAVRIVRRSVHCAQRGPAP